jgi:predicted nucleotidyltransferase
VNLAKNIPKDLADLFEEMATDFPEILRENLVGIYLWGSLTYDAFDERYSDVDCIVVTARGLDEREFSELDEWFTKKGEQSRWVKRIDMRFVIDHEFLDKASRCCGFYHYAGKLARHGSDGNPIIWMNIAQSGVTLCGKDAKLTAPHVSDQGLNDALLLELNYLQEDLSSNAGDRSDKAFIHNAYAVLTACRILYTAYHRKLISKDQAYEWAMGIVPPIWCSVIRASRENRLKNSGLTTPELEQDAMRFVGFVAEEVKHILGDRVGP